MSANNYRFYKGGRATHPKLMMLSVTEAISFIFSPCQGIKTQTQDSSLSFLSYHMTTGWSLVFRSANASMKLFSQE
jgi:hypothetical protein